MKAGAVNFLPKPFDEDDMLTTVAEAVSRDRGRREQCAQAGVRCLRYEGLMGVNARSCRLWPRG
jgi:FixJ family two-component response regulator